MDYTEETLLQLIEDASNRGKPDLVKYYQSELDKLRKKNQ